MDCLRSLTVEDIQQARELSDAEGWNQTYHDWKLLITAPGNVCLAFTSGNKIIATATAMKYGNKLAWIGMVLVHRNHRGKGISKRLVAALLDNLKSCRSVMLDATPAGQPVYEKFGFNSEFLVHRMTADAIAQDLLHPERNLPVVPVAVHNIAEIIRCDREATGVDRKTLIEFLISEYPQDACLIKKGDRIKGFVLGRKGIRFHHIGPLVAETAEDAQALLINILNNYIGKPVVLDIPDDKHILTDWLLNAGFKIQRHFIRMHLGEKSLQGIFQKIFLISGPEFG